MKHLRPSTNLFLGELFAPPVSKLNVPTTVNPLTQDDICKNHHKGNPMSVQANKIAHEFKASKRQRIIHALQPWTGMNLDSAGLTCEELETRTGLSHQTCSARLSELKREGKIKVVGNRKTRSGSLASVYQVI